ncbi:dihydrofolate reductase family protein [Cellulomonas sp.]|uniref:dihydrofolate reductase family protein n=1 Tax=Cellulomonas sp. TaxID=40001 RepID=UPI001B2D3AED|nr:dihydrofolate reductase family protein [Cellulomonas sp.]MBO9555642.1 dihydrofolate reductase family protein [Cellulomonas sp.]
MNDVPDDFPALDVLLPVDRAGTRIEPRADEAELLGAFTDRLPLEPPRGVHVRANMVSSVDGGATGADHRSGSINDAADFRVFRVLRALADVVLIGAGTARAEQYRALDVPDELREARRALGRTPEIELAIVSASGDVPDALLDGERPPLVLTTGTCPRLDELGDRIGPERLILTEADTPGTVDLRVALAALGARGLAHVLTEGGPTLLGQLVGADLVDELCQTFSPVLVGGPAPRVVDLPMWLDPARELRPLHLLHAGGVLLGRWQVVRLGA